MLLQPVYPHFCNNISGVTLYPRGVFGINKIRIVIISLIIEDGPLVKTFRLPVKVPFAENGSFVSRLLKKLGKGRLGSIKCFTVHSESINMAVFPRQYDRSTGTANRVGAKIILE